MKNIFLVVLLLQKPFVLVTQNKLNAFEMSRGQNNHISFLHFLNLYEYFMWKFKANKFRILLRICVYLPSRWSLLCSPNSLNCERITWRTHWMTHFFLLCCAWQCPHWPGPLCVYCGRWLCWYGIGWPHVICARVAGIGSVGCLQEASGWTGGAHSHCAGVGFSRQVQRSSIGICRVGSARARVHVYVSARGACNVSVCCTCRRRLTQRHSTFGDFVCAWGWACGWSAWRLSFLEPEHGQLLHLPQGVSAETNF